MRKIFLILFLLSCFLTTFSTQDTTAKTSMDTAVNPITLDKVHHSDSIVQTQRNIEVRPNKVDFENTLADDGFWKLLDTELAPGMAATLAGLSLTALALLISVLSSIETNIGQLARYPNVKKDEEDRATNIRMAIYYIKCSFFWFIAFLAETLTIDILQDSNSFSFEWILDSDILEVLLSGGLLSVGLMYLVRGAIKMAKGIN